MAGAETYGGGAGSLPPPRSANIDDRVDVEELSAVVVHAAYRIHRELGSGLLESVYEAVLAKVLCDQGLVVARQFPVAIDYAGVRLNEGFRVDVLVAGRLVVELKSVEQIAPVHCKQLLTYVRLLKSPLGLLINFGAATFKDGIKRIVNDHREFASSRLRVNQLP
jgi:GxxExxY protein